VLAGLVAIAWIALMTWSRSPYGRYVNHPSWFDMGPGAALCSAIPGGSVILPALLHTIAWMTMIAAMMLPTTLPLLDRFRRLIMARGDRHVLLGLVVAGYLAVWGTFGLVAHGVDRLVLAAFERSPWLALHGWAAGAAVIFVAGAFQFSSLKYRCLEQCRSPLSFVMSHWHGPTPRRSAFALGAHHGAFCVGCCWALMLLMFVVGTGSIGWMLALGAIMAVEKNLPWGRRLSTPLGVALLTWAAAIVAINLGAGNAA